MMFVVMMFVVLLVVVLVLVAALTVPFSAVFRFRPQVFLSAVRVNLPFWYK